MNILNYRKIITSPLSQRIKPINQNQSKMLKLKTYPDYTLDSPYGVVPKPLVGLVK